MKMMRQLMKEYDVYKQVKLERMVYSGLLQPSPIFKRMFESVVTFFF